MTHIWAIARKELRGYFNSAVAVIFLATFLLFVMYSFFWQETFFARGIADVRPMFEWLPILLIVLVSALTMRLWSEEHKLGTIEILLTLPVPIYKLVLGKFFAGLTLVAIALGLTLGLPISVSILGNLDWGPVIGGYVAALLLAGAYLSIGLCVSASTDNQIVSLVLTALFCACLYVPGTEAVSGALGGIWGEVARAIGTGSRFESVARGVIDFRDLAYWLGIIGFFLLLNTVLLHARRWSQGPRSKPSRQTAWLSLVLVGANVLALNLWMRPLARARLDLTENNEYTLSSTTEKLLESLDEELTIRGYFAEDSHPVVKALAPQIRDRLKEYKVLGGDKVRLEFIDPFDDEELEKEAGETYGIFSEPLQYSDYRQKQIANSFHHILIAYGDQYQVLNLRELIEPIPGTKGREFRLRNFEYDITKTIRKEVNGFQGVSEIFAALREDAKLTLYASANLPAGLPEMRKSVVSVAKDMVSQSNGKFTFVEEAPADSQEAVQKLWQEKRIKPYASPAGPFYFTPVLEIGDRSTILQVSAETKEIEIRDTIEELLMRATPGFLKTVGMVVPKPKLQQPRPGMPPSRPTPPQSFKSLNRVLSENYQVREIQPEEGIESDIDVLILAGPENLTDRALREVDQFLMSGGAVIVLTGQFRVNQKRQDLSVEPVKSGILPMLEHYGVKVSNKLIADKNAVVFPVPDGRGQVRMKPFPLFPLITGDELMQGSPVLAQINALVLFWSSPLEVVVGNSEGDDEAKKIDVQILAKSSEDAWTLTGTMSTPNYTLQPETGFPPPSQEEIDAKKSIPLIVSLVGSIPSYFAEKDDPANNPNFDPTKDRLLQTSSEDARLIVIGSSEFASDIGSYIAQQTAMEGLNNLSLLHNMVDWALQDAELLEIRNRGAQNRVLRVTDEQATNWQIFNIVMAGLALALIFGINAARRRSQAPLVAFDPKPPSGKSPKPGATGSKTTTGQEYGATAPKSENSKGENNE